MTNVIIDLDMLQKEINQHETMAVNSKDQDQRDVYFAISHVLQRMASKTSSMKPVIIDVWNHALLSTADREGYINVNMDPEVIKLEDLKKTIIHGKESETKT